MKILTYKEPKSSFLSVEKDLSTITTTLLKNERLKKLLFYTTKDCLNKPDLNEDESLSLLGQNIKLIPKVYVDKSILNYIIVSFNHFMPNDTNPEFRDNVIEFNIICHFDQWQLGDFQLRPYRIAAEIDSMLDGSHLSGIGTLQFLGANQLVMNEEYAGLSIVYEAIHGEDDKKGMLNPADNAQFIEDFNRMVNDQWTSAQP